MRRRTLGEICRIEYGRSLPDKQRQAGGVAVYGSNGVVGTHQTGFTQGRTVVIGRKGSIGQVHYSERSCWPIDTTYYIDETCTEVDIRWLSYALRYLRLDVLNKASGVPGLNRDDAYRQELTVPESRDEQQRVASQLDLWYVELKAGKDAMQVRTEDITLLRRRVLDEVFASVADSPQKRLGDFAYTTSGSTPGRGVTAYWTPAEVPWVKTGEIAFSPITQTEEAISAKALKECSLTLLPPETVLVAMYGQGKTRGQSAVLKVSATTNQACFAILPNDTWDSEFLFYWLMASYLDLRALSEGRGGNQANLNGGLLNALEIPAPSREQQIAIARRAQDALREVDALAAANTAQQEELDRLPQRLLAQVFAH